jgi:shikimate kinase
MNLFSNDLITGFFNDKMPLISTEDMNEYSNEIYADLSKESKYRMFSAKADWTLTHTCHKNKKQGTVEAAITLNGVTLTDSLIR